jgi:hypothetical protein
VHLPRRLGNNRLGTIRTGNKRVITTAVTALLGFTVVAMAAAPAQAAGPVGYVRLAHLSPDTPKVDVYLSKVSDASFEPQVFQHVGYGVMTSYLALPVGTYAVAMRTEGAPADSAPVLTTQVTVADGGAYTVAGVGKFAALGLKVLADDLTRPANGMAKVRVIQASVKAPMLDVELTDGTPVAKGAAFATTTEYQVVKPGSWTLNLKPSGSSSATTLSADLVAGSVYSLLVLDGANGLALQLRADARGGASAPDGGIDAGGGGSALWSSWPVIAGGVLLVIALALVAARMRRMAALRR